MAPRKSAKLKPFLKKYERKTDSNIYIFFKLPLFCIATNPVSSVWYINCGTEGPAVQGGASIAMPKDLESKNI